MDNFTRVHLEEYAKRTFEFGHIVGFVSWVDSHDAEDIDYWCGAGWPVAAEQYRRDAYYAYIEACDEENLDAHEYKMWEVHNKPKGPLG